MSASSGDPPFFLTSSGFPATVLLAPASGRRPRGWREALAAVVRGAPVLVLALALGLAAAATWRSTRPPTWEAVATLRVPAAVAEALPGQDGPSDGLSLQLRAAEGALPIVDLRLARGEPGLAVQALRQVVDRALRLAAARRRQQADAAHRAWRAEQARGDEAGRLAGQALLALLAVEGGEGGEGAFDGPHLRLQPDPVPADGAWARPGAEAGSPAGAGPVLRLDMQAPEDPSASEVGGATPVFDDARAGPAPPATGPSPDAGTLRARVADLLHQQARAAGRVRALQARLDALAARVGESPAAQVMLPPSLASDGPVPAPAGLLPLGALAGLLAGLAAVLAREVTTDRLRDEHDVRWSLGLPVLGSLPVLGAKARRALAGVRTPAASGVDRPAPVDDADDAGSRDTASSTSLGDTRSP